MGKKKLTKTQKRNFREALRNDPEARKKSVDDAAEHTKQCLEYVKQKASMDLDCGQDMKLREYIDETIKSMKKELLFVLNLMASDDTEIGSDKDD